MTSNTFLAQLVDLYADVLLQYSWYRSLQDIQGVFRSLVTALGFACMHVCNSHLLLACHQPKPALQCTTMHACIVQLNPVQCNPCTTTCCLQANKVLSLPLGACNVNDKWGSMQSTAEDPDISPASEKEMVPCRQPGMCVIQ